MLLCMYAFAASGPRAAVICTIWGSACYPERAMSLPHVIQTPKQHPTSPTPPQGYNYSVAFPAGHVPTGNLNVSIYSSTNCGSTTKPLYSFTTNRKPAPTSDGGAVLTLTVPTTIKGDGLFLQLASGSARNYSDTFSILPK